MAASITWPATLPNPQADQYSEAPPNGVVRTEMDSGPAKIRRRYTAAPRMFQLMFRLTSTQLAAFDLFFVTTSKMGALRFNYTHPRTSVACEARFVGTPTYSDPIGAECDVAFQVEVLP